MIDKQAAHQIAQDYVQQMAKASQHDFVLFEDKTQELDFGWVFFYSTRQHVETGDPRHAVPGNAPIIVDRQDGSLHPTGTAKGTQYYIDEYRKQRSG
jgi:hypothetical protein